MPRAVVLDIEGTTSATSYVTEQLYPYSARRFASWIDEHGGDGGDPDTVRAVRQVREFLGDPAAGTGEVVAQLTRWLAADEKVPALKAVQGRIWADGFDQGELVAHFYPDVIGCMREWHAAGHRLYVFSSGSLSAQRAWFGHSPDGDLLPLLSGHFDTENAGPKKDPGAYRAITTAIGADPAATVFLSDVRTELDAARAAGWRTVGVRRPGEAQYGAGVGDHVEVATFADVDVSSA